MKNFIYLCIVVLFVVSSSAQQSHTKYHQATQSGTNQTHDQTHGQTQKQSEKTETLGASPPSTESLKSIQDLVKSVGILKDIQRDALNSQTSLWKQVLFVITHPDFSHYMEGISANPNMEIFWFLEGLAFILLILFRSWKFSKSLSFDRYLWTELWTGYLSLTIVFLLIPLVLFQKDLINLIIVACVLWSGQLPQM